ncbi:MAG: hypothetical protein MRY64_02505 [Hyphomonadaceae bacterium]|nr:hypothetical protein [Hyphomonadaceae bacterium]
MESMIWWILPAISGVIGLMLSFAGLGRVFNLQVVSGGARVFFGLGFLGLAGIVTLAGLNLQTYKRLIYERPVANISFEDAGEPGLYRALVVLEGDTEPLAGPGFESLQRMRGDEWSLGARVIKFKSLANMLGYDAVYKLDRLQTGFEEDTGENVSRVVVRLNEDPSKLARQALQAHGNKVGIQDAHYGSAVYNPMGDGLSYDIYMTQDALIARSANAATRARIGEPVTVARPDTDESQQ